MSEGYWPLLAVPRARVICARLWQDRFSEATLTSVSGNHNRSCARAVGHVCRCTGCFGSLHGWEGWTTLANAVASERQSKRERVDAQWARHYRPAGKRLNGRSKAARTDLARLDIADWLAYDKEFGHTVVPAQRQSPDDMITGSGTELNDQSSKPSNSNAGPSELQLEYAEPGDRPRENDNRYELQTESSEQNELGDAPVASSKIDHVMTRSDPDESVSERVRAGVGQSKGHGQYRSPSDRSERDEPDDRRLRPSAVEQVIIFAEAMTTSVRKEIEAELDDKKNAPEIKRQLADHVWCDLFIGLVKVVKKYQDCLSRIPEDAKEIVKWAILGSSMQAKRSAVARKIVDIVVDKVWQVFKTAAFANYPLLSILDSKEILRSLRILAVFTCPAPENHREVYEYAFKPLGDDAMTILNEQTKKWLAKVFEEWVTGSDESASADLTVVKP